MDTEHNPEFFYLTTVGRKSGQLREIEIWYVPLAGNYYLIAENGHNADWVKNLQANPHVAFWVEGKLHKGAARIVDAAQEVKLHEAVCALFHDKYEWNEGLVVEVRSI